MKSKLILALFVLLVASIGSERSARANVFFFSTLGRSGGTVVCGTFQQYWLCQAEIWEELPANSLAECKAACEARPGTTCCDWTDYGNGSKWCGATSGPATFGGDGSSYMVYSRAAMCTTQ